MNKSNISNETLNHLKSIVGINNLMQRGQFFIIKQEKYYTSCDVEYAIGQHNYLTTSVENRLNLDVLSRDIN